MTASRTDPRALESVEIDRQVHEAIKDGCSLYAVDAELIDRLAPDVIVTQDLCTVCAVSSGELGSACPVGATLISLDPSTLDGGRRVDRDARHGAPRARAGSELAGETRYETFEIRPSSLARQYALHASIHASYQNQWFATHAP